MGSPFASARLAGVGIVHRAERRPVMIIPGHGTPYGLLNSLDSNYRAINTSLERLSTGKRINRAGDDPSGMLAADGFRSSIVLLQSEMKMLQRTDAVAKTADGALAEISEMLSRADSLGVEFANEGGLSDAEREAIRTEINSIADGVDHILNTTTFNGRTLFTDDLRLAANEDRLTIHRLSLEKLDEKKTVEEKVAYLKQLNSKVLDGRARLGSFSRRVIGSQTRRIGNAIEQLGKAESMIRDTDVAKEASQLARAQVLAEAAIRSLDFLRDSMGQLLKLIGVE